MGPFTLLLMHSLAAGSLLFLVRERLKKAAVEIPVTLDGLTAELTTPMPPLPSGTIIVFYCVWIAALACVTAFSVEPMLCPIGKATPVCVALWVVSLLAAARSMAPIVGAALI